MINIGNNILQTLKNQCGQIYPDYNVFTPSHYVPADEIKVIIIGKQPHASFSSDGLAFSTRFGHKRFRDTAAVLKELEIDYGYKYKSGSLEAWASEGVLLLNDILTVDKKKPHKVWKDYTTRMINYVLLYKRPIVIIAWGREAQRKLKNLDLHHNVKVIKGPYPTSPGFHNKYYFSRADMWLIANGRMPVDWRLQ